MPSDIVKQLMAEVKEIKQDLNQHLIESGGIKTKLTINTWLTLAIFASLIANYFKR